MVTLCKTKQSHPIPHSKHSLRLMFRLTGVLTAHERLSRPHTGCQTATSRRFANPLGV